MAAPLKPRALLKVPLSIKMQAWLVDWLRTQPEPQITLIERAIIKQYKLKAPKGDDNAIHS